MTQPPQMIGMDQDLLGATLAGRYEVTALMAQGGMGRLYLATQQPLGRTVVVKVMTPAQLLNTDPAALQARFFREAATCARLRHPNTVTVFDYGELELSAGQTFFMVMEHLDGRTLAEELREKGRLAPARALWIGAQITRSLREAHAYGVVHRDLKPSNVMLVDGPDGEQVKVLDFGIAKLLSEPDEDEDTPSAPELTRQGDVVGSPSYMSPEQVTHDDIGIRSDFYSLGAVLFHLIAGQRPFRARSATMRMMAHVHRPTPSLTEVLSDVHPAIDALVQRCMAKDPADRYPTADALLAAIHEALALIGEPLPASETTSPPLLEEATLAKAAAAEADDPTTPPPSRRRLVSIVALVGGVLAAVVLVLGVGGVWWMQRGQQPAPAPAPEPQPVVEAAVEPAPAPTPVELVLTSKPAGAEVLRGGEALGKTPLTLSVAPDAGAQVYTLRADGHTPTEVGWSPGEPAPETVVLAPLPPAAPTRPARPREDIILER